MHHTVLAAVPQRERERLLAGARRRVFASSEVVFHEGDLGDALHVIVHGHVAIRRVTPRGDVLILALLGPGDQFGELSLLRADHRHTATGVALDAVETLSVGRGAFDRMCRDDPATALALAHILAASVTRLDRSLVEAYYLPADRRVARRLCEAARVFCGTSVPLTQEDLAAMAGASRSTVNQVLRRLERDGVLSLHRHHIEVLDPEALQAAGRW